MSTTVVFTNFVRRVELYVITHRACDVNFYISCVINNKLVEFGTVLILPNVIQNRYVVLSIFLQKKRNRIA